MHQHDTGSLSGLTHAHHHDLHDDLAGRHLVIVMALNLVIVVVQGIGGIVSGSVALLSDAVHNLSDFSSLAIAYVADRIGRREVSAANTFGYKRAEILAAAINVTLLLLIAAFIIWRAYLRLLSPQPVEGTIVAALALIGFVANAGCVLILRRDAKDNLNIRSALYHLATDALTSLGVLAAGIVIIFTGWYPIDSLISFVVALLIVKSSWDIMKEAVNILMNGTPYGLDIHEIKKDLERLDGVEDIHHVHVWNVSSKSIAFACHVLVQDQPLSRVDCLAEEMREKLFCDYGIDHPILQFESRKHSGVGVSCEGIFCTNNYCVRPLKAHAHD
jgi:cobalt-zinc-cadmium efflux system protein